MSQGIALKNSSQFHVTGNCLLKLKELPGVKTNKELTWDSQVKLTWKINSVQYRNSTLSMVYKRCTQKFYVVLKSLSFHDLFSTGVS